MPKHLILVGACYVDTILTVPQYPEEDSKLRASRIETRYGGNCPNSLRVIQQLRQDQDDLNLHLITCLPSKESSATQKIIQSFDQQLQKSSFQYCLCREDLTDPASSYIIRSEETGSRTIVNHNALPEMTVGEFEKILASFDGKNDEAWWHFEGRIPYVIIRCVQKIRAQKSMVRHTVSVEIEKPGREGLLQLARMADVVFYARSWAEDRGHRSPEDCLEAESNPRALHAFCTWGADGAAALQNGRPPCRARVPIADLVHVIDAIGAGDTFIAGALYSLICHEEDWNVHQKLNFAVDLATKKVQQNGFDGLGNGVLRAG